MRMSFLLPTRNRLDYLKLAIETVRRQDSPDWEIVVSDNCSEDDIEGHIRSLAEPRIVYGRSDRPLPVTENWNRALEMSSGDYVLMLGDDDGLLPGYVRRMQGLIERFEAPEMIYTGALLFTYPDVDPGEPAGFLADNTHAEFFGSATEPFVLSHERALEAVRAVMDFRLAFNFNMQLSLLSRSLLERIAREGAVFHSAFPDYYATSVALLEAEKVVADPAAEVVIGVTPKSYGFFHVNEREREGREFLGGQNERTLPGTNINDGWLSAVEAIERNWGLRHGLLANQRRYRFLQASYTYTARRRGSASAQDVARLNEGLPIGERLLYRSADVLGRLLVRVVPSKLWQRLMQRGQGQFPDTWEPPRVTGRYRDLLEVFEDRSSGGT